VTRYSTHIHLLFRRQPRQLPSFPTRRSSDLLHFTNGRGCLQPVHLRHGDVHQDQTGRGRAKGLDRLPAVLDDPEGQAGFTEDLRSEEHTSELQSRENLVCRLLLEKKKSELCK